MKSIMHSGATKELYQRARELRIRSTHAEEVLWMYLRTKPLNFKFRRQHPYACYILDFYCHKLKLVIEVDGSIHEKEDVKQSDIQRQVTLEKDGLTVLRFTNEEILTHQEQVLQQIEAFITSRKSRNG